MSQANLKGVPLTPTSDSGTPSSKRLCSQCDEPIPEKRLRAMPGATECVPCLEEMGDVPRLRRYDEFTKDGDRVETVFTHNPLIEEHIAYGNHIELSERYFNFAVGDDSHLEREDQAGYDVARHLSTEFEDESDETNNNISLNGREKIALSNQKRWAQWRVNRNEARDGDYELLGLPVPAVNATNYAATA